ncbi:hypothetical protein HU200_005036 [Digitaria exilis]|uniref:Uncharacterized protein n=1 Tax=Digitaria exilis TaxID=1010633 RepID=A0A835FRI5_9POAL|nr:hypothetical protein HU200_005036 [Digitaria exilis]
MSTIALCLLATAVLLIVIAGKYNPIKDMSDPYIQELAMSSTMATKLIGMNNKLVHDAMDTTATVKKYRVLVFDH